MQNIIDENLKLKIDNAKIVSFDIFDTLLVRPYVKPTDLFIHLEKLIAAKGYAKARINAEKQARKCSNKVEITIEDIYNFIPDKYKYLKQKEMEFEYRTARLNPLIIPILDYVRQQGKKIIIISSMYLPQQLLEKILNKIGVSDYSRIYVSCEVQKNKRDASIYKHVLEDLSCTPEQILHIGDNEAADITPATSLNIHTHLIPKLAEYFIEQDSRIKTLLTKFSGEVEASVFTALAAYFCVKNNLVQEDIKESDYFRFIGYILGGPLAYQYVSWIAENCKQKTINDIVFIARDGYSLSKVMSIIEPKFNPVYVYAPRKLSLGISLDYDKNNFDQVTSISQFYKKALNYKTSTNDALFPTKEIEQEFINSHSEEIFSMREKLKEDYLAYLNDIQFNKENFALVDTATLWATASRLFVSLFPNAKINSYYWRLNEPFNKGNLSIDYFDTENKSKALIKPYDIIEFLFTAPEPSVNTIKNKKVVYAPQTDAEMKRNKIYLYISEGITCFAQDVNDIFAGEVITFSKNLVFNWVNIFIGSPNHKDRYFFQDIKHAGDINHNYYKTLFKDWYKNTELPINKNPLEYFSPKPFSKENNIPIIFASSNYFTPFMGVALTSLIKNTTAANNYDIFILHTEINIQHQLRIKNLEKNNVSIRFIDLNRYIKEYKNLMFIRDRMSIVTYFRFFIPEIFKNYQKCIWLDSDIIVNKDIAELYKTDIGNNYAAACREFGVLRLLYTNIKNEGNWRNYVRSQLMLSDATKYFSAAVMIWNIEQLAKTDFTTQCFNKLKEIPNPYTYDQDVLNSLLQDKIVHLDANWNLPWNLEIKYPFFREELPENVVKEYEEARNNPYIIHYCGAHKPWNHINNYLSDIYWKHAKKSDFYEEILSYIYATKSDNSKVQTNLQNLLSLSNRYYKICMNYYRCKLLQKISSGKRKEHYQKKKDALKSQIRIIRDLK